MIDRWFEAQACRVGRALTLSPDRGTRTARRETRARLESATADIHRLAAADVVWRDARPGIEVRW